MLNFEWHREKENLNIKKHNVTFNEAQTVFEDPLGIYKLDYVHSIGEERSYLIGNSNKNRLIVVSFTERADKIRIISARLATKNERIIYENRG